MALNRLTDKGKRLIGQPARCSGDRTSFSRMRLNGLIDTFSDRARDGAT